MWSTDQNLKWTRFLNWPFLSTASVQFILFKCIKVHAYKKSASSFPRILCIRCFCPKHHQIRISETQVQVDQWQWQWLVDLSIKALGSRRRCQLPRWWRGLRHPHLLILLSTLHSHFRRKDISLNISRPQFSSTAQVAAAAQNVTHTRLETHKH